MSTDVNVSPSKKTSKWNFSAQATQLADLLEQPRILNTVLILVLLVAALLRFTGLNWDEGHHLHPDERFLSTVTNDLFWPENLSNYFNPDISTLSPYSNPNMGLYVYGMLPVYIVKWVAIQLDKNNYDQITLVGRAMSGLFDIGSIFLLFLIAKKLYGKKVGLLAAVLLSFSVLNIQLSHFYTVDTFANLFILATIYFLLRGQESGRWIDYVLTGLMFGLGLASKLSVFTLVAPILVIVGFDFYRRVQEGDMYRAIEHTFWRTLTLFIVAIVTFRILQPIAFAGPGFWNWTFNPKWVEDIVEQQKITRGQTDLPWVQQWTGRSIAFPLYNILLWGMGLPLGLASFAGLALAGYELIRYRRLEHLIPVTYVGVTFVYHAITFIKFMRYFLPIYPFLILLAAYLISRLWDSSFVSAPQSDVAPEAESSRRNLFKRTRRILSTGLNASLLSRPVVLTIISLVVTGTFLYALAFASIYSRPNTRIAASRWMHQNIPAGSVLANEHWDDWLPIGGVDGVVSYGDTGLFSAVEMRNYEDDTPDKLNWMVENLTQADYVILSSNRLYDSIPRLPMRYPLTMHYYQLLFNGKLGYERVKDFTSYPTLFGIQIPDQSAEESFSVYDHPRVQIFKKTAAFNAEEARNLLSKGVVWESAVHLTPLQASAAPGGLMLTPEEQVAYKAAAEYSSSNVNENSWGSQVPLLAWFLIVELIGLLALPLTMTTFQRLTDRGYVFSKSIGLLIIAWGSWIISSLRIAPFIWWVILIVALLLGVVSFFVTRQRWDELKNFARTNWKLLAWEEIGFWLFFGILLFVRFRNPDLWHPGMGGEKPMDLAYLTAITRTPYFPSYDPWFTGGYINYYYFGFVLVATLIHLTGMVPYIAYNLAVPTFFALTAMGGFAVAMNFGMGRQINLKRLVLVGLSGALFVAVIGNLAQVKVIVNGVRGLSTIQLDNGAPAILKFAQFTDGLNHWMVERELTSVRTEWWYWNSTRVIPPAEGEAGPINELPFFTFLFGDLHAHMMSLPFTLLVLALALNFIRGRTDDSIPWWRDPIDRLTLILLTFTIGALWPINTWDFPTYSLLVAAAFTIRAYTQRRRIDFTALTIAVMQFILVLIVGRLLFQPFHSNYAGSNFGIELWKGSKTPLWAYLMIHGFFLFVIVSYLIDDFLHGSGHNAIVRAVRLKLKYWRRNARLRELLDHLTYTKPSYKLALDSIRVMFTIVVALLLLKPVIGVALLLTFLSALLLFSRRLSPARQMLLSMIGLGLILTAVVEVLVIKGDISRMNTVFKFYLQVWVLWAVASAAVLPQLAARFRRRSTMKRVMLPEPAEGTAWTPQVAAMYERNRRTSNYAGSRLWWTAFSLLLAACLLYPLTAAPVRIKDRFPESTSATLNGTTYMQTSTYFDDGRPVPLEWDRQATEWIRENIRGIPTIVEASTPLYRWGSRVSIYTGLPSIIGWDWHQKQQRSILPGQVIEKRIQDTNAIFTSTDSQQLQNLLNQYHVEYIYVGPLERLYYAGDGINKFDQPNPLWKLVYENPQVKIYEVNHGQN
jgi:YYY domain-containing protein